MNKIESGGFVKRLSVVICGYLDLDDGIQWMGEGPGWSRAPRATEAAQPAPEAGSRVVILRFGNHGATHDLYDLSSKS